MAHFDDWNRLVQEAAVDPHRRIIDAHHHLWPENDGPHPGPAYLHPQLLSDIASHNVVGTIYVECGARLRREGPEELRGVGETEFAADQAAQSASTKAPIAAIVAGADLRLGDRLGGVLDAHAAAGRGLFRGIRQRHDRRGKDAGYNPLIDAAVLPALRLMGQRGYVFDAFAIFSRLEQLSDLARTMPETVIVLEHLGVPLTNGQYGDRDTVMAVWRAGILAVAKCPNVVLKLGGIGMDSLYGIGWSTRSMPPTSDEVVGRWRDQIRFCIDALGPSRCMFESNYPVDGEGIGYTVLWNAFQKIAAAYSDAEQEWMFSGTAIRTYRLERLDRDEACEHPGGRHTAWGDV